ncbi:multidrug effflux MFS transporter [Tepidamorphus sp. 3E244]|uniref:multidrug effflux MFS transporter n=1 Tax=Tepidamorphus sp. 3E244 TaxID=3385498 RepID=UPI0038FD2583
MRSRALFHKHAMKLKPDTIAMTVTLGLLTALGPLATDMYLPSLPAMAQKLNADIPQIQLTLSGFLVGFALCQIAYGPVSDRLGRRKVLVFSLLAFTVASAACTLAHSVEMLVVARFAQALGAGGGVVIARAVVRDLYDADRAGQELALMGTILGIVPLFAPTLGALLHEVFGWRSNFAVMAGFGLAGAAFIHFAMPETLKFEFVRPATLRSIAADFAALVRNPFFRVYLVFACCAYGGLFSFLSASSFVLQQVYGLSPMTFGIAFACPVLGYMAGTLAGRRITRQRGIDGTIALGALTLLTGGLLAVALTETAAPGTQAWRLLVPSAIYFAGVGLVLPQALAGAMTPFPERAGTASSLVGFTQMSVAAIIGIVVSANLSSDARALTIALAVMGSTAFAAHLASRRMRAGVLPR